MHSGEAFLCVSLRFIAFLRLRGGRSPDGGTEIDHTGIRDDGGRPCDILSEQAAPIVHEAIWEFWTTTKNS